MGNNLFDYAIMEYKDIAIYFGLLVQALIVYIFNDKKKELQQDISDLKKKITKIEAGDFVEKLVKNVIYSPESRNYFKSIFSEAIEHKNKNNLLVNKDILETLQSIELRLNEKK